MFNFMRRSAWIGFTASRSIETSPGHSPRRTERGRAPASALTPFGEAMRWGDMRSSDNVEDCEGGGGGGGAAKCNLLDPGDVAEGLRAATSVGGVTIQKRTQEYMVPAAFAHGRADQRMRWFKIGLRSDDPRVCNIFAVKDL